MDILYCGNDKVEDGLLLSTLSLTRTVSEPLHIHVLTMRLEVGETQYLPISESLTGYLDHLVKGVNPESTVSRIDITALFNRQPPTANLDTRFTPYCMLRLYADQIPELPDKLLYLDTDVLCRRDCTEFYRQDITGYEFLGTLDYYGSWFFRRNPFRRDYINSGVLLMNLAMIRKTGLLETCRQMCAEKTMFMPDQSALNKAATAKKIVSRRFNEQRKLHGDTVFQHFTTSFRFIPWFRILTVKPWEIDKVHDKLKLHEYDDLLDEYARLQAELGG